MQVSRPRAHGWSPGQRPWDVATRIPAEYPSFVSRVEHAGMSVMIRLEGDADFYQARRGEPVPQPAQKQVAPGRQAGELATPQQRSAPAIDDDLAEIEAILKKRGIS